MGAESERSVPNGSGKAVTCILCFLLIAFGITTLLVDYLQPFAPRWSIPVTEQTLSYAQTGKNLARGKGFTTEWILPPALKHARSIERVPDLCNPPLYPVCLGVFFALFGAQYQTILLCAGVLFLAAGICIFLFARGVFGPYAALAAAALFLSHPIVRRNVMEGGNIALLILLMTVLFWRIYASQMSTPRDNWLIGALAGLCYLTEYPYWVLMLPLCASCLIASGEERGRNLVALVGGFCAASACWWIRNILVTGNPFFTLRTGAGLYGTGFISALEPALKGGGELFRPRARLQNLGMQSGQLVTVFNNWLVPLFVAAAFWRCENARMQWTRKVLYASWATIWILVGSWTHTITAVTVFPFLPLVCIIVSGFIFRISTVLDLRRPFVCVALAVALVVLNACVLSQWQLAPYDSFHHTYLDKVPREKMFFADRALPISWLKDRPAINMPLDAEDCAKIASMLPGGVAVYMGEDFAGEYGASSTFWIGIHAEARNGVLSRALPVRHGELFGDGEYLFY